MITNLLAILCWIHFGYVLGGYVPGGYVPDGYVGYVLAGYVPSIVPFMLCLRPVFVIFRPHSDYDPLDVQPDYGPVMSLWICSMGHISQPRSIWQSVQMILICG